MPTEAPNPLIELHRQTDAEFQGWGEIPIVQTFGQPQAEYAAMRKSVGLIDLPQRGFLELTGKDRLPFLNNLLTNETWNKSTKTGMKAGEGIYSFMLNLQGRVVADMNVLELVDRTLVEMDIRLIEPLRQVLEKYLFAEQVKIQSRIGQLHEIALHGPGAEVFLGVSLSSPGQSTTAKLFEIDVTVWRDDPTGKPGYYIIVPTDAVQAIWSKLAPPLKDEEEFDRRVPRPIGWAAFNAARVEAGRPIFGIDFDGAAIASALPGKREVAPEQAGIGALPAETGLLNRAVSFTKGCYLGQEIVARMHARGQVARQIAGVRMHADALPIAGEQIFDEQSNPIGIITSSTISPILSNASICLAMLKRPHFNVGTKLQIPAEGAMRTGEVVSLPFIQGNA